MKKNATRRIIAILLAVVMCMGFTSNAQGMDADISQQSQQSEQNKNNEPEGSAGEKSSGKEGNSQNEIKEEEMILDKTGTQEETDAFSDNVSEPDSSDEKEEEQMQPAAAQEVQEVTPQSASNLSNPRIEEDSSMEARQKVTWDCVWFGSYPQSEVVVLGGRLYCYKQRFAEGRRSYRRQ